VQHHLEWLRRFENSEGGEISDYASLFRQTADQLVEGGLYARALDFYQLLRRAPDAVDASLLIQLGRCLVRLENYKEAEESFQSTIQIDAKNIDARVEMARMLEQMDEPERAFELINEVMILRKKTGNSSIKEPPRKKRKYVRKFKTGIEKASPKKQQSQPDKGREEQSQNQGKESKHATGDITDEEQLRAQLFRLRKYRDEMRNGDVDAIQIWMEAAGALTDDFRSFKSFYPWDKYVRFEGYFPDSRVQAETPLELDLRAQTEGASEGILTIYCLLVPVLTCLDPENNTRKKIPGLSEEVPKEYRGIPFSMWLDIFLEHALCLARNGRMRESYDLCEAAKDCSVFYHSREDIFLIHVTWCSKFGSPDGYI
jgi:general transcription factor 3C polypeptide 3 (transcription factor C subunit 4)